MPVPFKDNISDLPNNYHLAEKRLPLLRKKMLQILKHGIAVSQEVTKLKQSQFIVLAAMNISGIENYLPYFFATRSNPRLVYDRSATCHGHSINNFIHSEPGLLNLQKFYPNSKWAKML